MPSVIDAPEIVEHEEHAVYEELYHHAEHPPVRKAHAGFWHTVLQYVKRHRVHTPHGMPSLSHGPLHPIEMPADMLARQYPSLYIRAYTGV